MSACIALRDDYDSLALRDLARRSRDPRQVRRLLALAAAYDGMSRTVAAKVGGMDRQTLRDWAHRFNDEGPDGLKHRSGAGRPRLLTQEQMSELSAIVETGPDPEVDGVVRWRRIDLKRVIEERFGVIYSERTLSDLLAALSFSHISGRSQHPQTGRAGHRGVQKNFPRTLAAHIAALPKTKRVEIWFQDEARLGQKNGHARIGAKTGTRPRLPADQRYANAYFPPLVLAEMVIVSEFLSGRNFGSSCSVMLPSERRQANDFRGNHFAHPVARPLRHNPRSMRRRTNARTTLTIPSAVSSQTPCCQAPKPITAAAKAGGPIRKPN